MFHDVEVIMNKANAELKMYFQQIAEASFGDMYDFERASICIPQLINQINNILIPPKDLDLRYIRRHVHHQYLHGSRFTIFSIIIIVQQN